MPSDFVVISPVRDEAEFLPDLINDMLAQSKRPALWIIVDDGSTDGTTAIAAAAAESNEWIRHHRRRDQGARRLGGGVVEAFRDGLAQVGEVDYDFLSKLDADLRLPPRYFETLVDKFLTDPKLGSASGQPYLRIGDRQVPERMRDDFSAGQAKFYRRTAFEQMDGLVTGLLWDAIDCHRCRQLGWTAQSFRDEALRFEHRRLMGSSDQGIRRGRRRWGEGHYFMGSHPLYFASVLVYRVFERPFVLGAVWMLMGYLSARRHGLERYDAPGFRAFLRQWQLAELGRPLHLWQRVG